MLETVLQERLLLQRQRHLYRIRQNLSFPLSQSNEINIDGCSVISFCSNDYLGLARHPSLIKAFKKGVETYGVGSGASCLITGYSKAHQEFEEAFAEFMQRDKALLFSAGYMANLGVIQALMSKKDIIYEDKRNHASLIDAGLLANAQLKRFKHNDDTHLEKLLSQQLTGNKLIVTDGVFSMEGDFASLPALSQLAVRNNSWLMVDDAHGVGILGKTGQGIVEHFNLSKKDIPILICPLGKAFGCFGAVVVGSENLIDYLIQFARTYIYTTAIPPAIAVAAKASLKLVRAETWRRERLQYLIDYFKVGAQQRNLKFEPSDTPIHAFIVNEASKSVQLSRYLLTNGFLVNAIRPPTVPPKTARLRITLNCLHQESQIDQLLDCLMKACQAIQSKIDGQAERF